MGRHTNSAYIGEVSKEVVEKRPNGTPRYRAPDGATDKTADIVAIGKIFKGLLVGRDSPLFPDLPTDMDWGGSEWDMDRVGAVIGKACAAKAVDRYADASLMLNDLERGSLLNFDSLFEEIESKPAPTGKSTEQAAIQLGFAFARLVPWLLGFAAVMYLISRLTR